MKNNPIKIEFSHNINNLMLLDFVNNTLKSFWVVFKFKAGVTYYLNTSKIIFKHDYVSFVSDSNSINIKGFKDLNGAVGLINYKSIKIENDSALDSIEVYIHLPSTILKSLFKLVNFENREIKKELNKWNKCLEYNNKTINALNSLYFTNQIRTRKK